MKNKDLAVIIGCTKEAGMLGEYRRQLEAAKIDVHIYRLDNFPNGCYGSIGYKLERMTEYINLHKDYKYLVFSDAFDVLFYGTKEQVIEAIPADHVIMAAEKNCFPDTYLAQYIKGKYPWRYVNGGLMAGSPETLVEWIQAIKIHAAYLPQLIDQQFFNHRLLEGRLDLVPLDTTTTLFYCMQQEMGELDFDKGRPFNSLTGTKPSFIHFNGGWNSTNFRVRQQNSLNSK